MKNLLFGLIATVMFGFSGNAQESRGLTNTSGTGVVAARIRLAGFSWCVGIPPISYCLNFEYYKAAPTKDEELIAATITKMTKSDYAIVICGKTKCIVFSGFDKSLENTKLNGSRTLIKDDLYSKAGTYIITNGQVSVPLEN